MSGFLHVSMTGDDLEGLGLLVLCAIGAATVCHWICMGMRALAMRWVVRRWFFPWLARRVERQLCALNAAWVLKIVRHAPSGRIGMGLAVRLRGCGWWAALRPRWTVDVALSPRLARAVVTPPEPEATSFGPVFILMPTGAGLREAFKLEELTGAPSGDAAAFRALMEEETI